MSGRHWRQRRRGLTLVDVLVALAIVGIALAVASVAPIALAGEGDRGRDPTIALRQSALGTGRDTTAMVVIGGRPTLVTARADGRMTFLRRDDPVRRLGEGDVER